MVEPYDRRVDYCPDDVGNSLEKVPGRATTWERCFRMTDRIPASGKTPWQTVMLDGCPLPITN